MGNYKISKSKNKNRKSWSINFFHPLIVNENTQEIERVRRGTGLEDEAKVDLLIQDLNKLIDNPKYHHVGQKSTAIEDGIDPKAANIFYDHVSVKSQEEYYEKLNEKISLKNFPYHVVVDIEGFSGAGKTTLLAQLLGLNPEKGEEKVLATSVNKTTVSDTEFIVVNSTNYSLICTFKEKLKIEEYLKSLLINTTKNIIEMLSQNNNILNYDILKRNFIETRNQEFRLHYLLGSISIKKENDTERRRQSNFQYDKNTNTELETIFNGFISKVKNSWESFISSHSVSILNENELGSLYDEFLEEIHDFILSNVDTLLDMIENVISKFVDGSLVNKPSYNNGWIEYIYEENLDRDKCLSLLKILSSNEQSLFGKLVSPIVASLRVSGPFYPEWIEINNRDSYKFIFVDGMGLDHIIKGDFSITPEVNAKLKRADKILWVHNANSVIKTESNQLFEHLILTGQINKLLLAFTHLDLMLGSNLESIDAKIDHINANLDNSLAEMDSTKVSIVKRSLQKTKFYLDYLDKALSSPFEDTILELKDLIEEFNIKEKQIQLPPGKLEFSRIDLFLKLLDAAETFNNRWLSLLGYLPQSSPLAWQTIKALSRRYAIFNTYSYNGYSPMSDMLKNINIAVFEFIGQPINNYEEYFSKDSLEIIQSEFMKQISDSLDDYSLYRIFKTQANDWKIAFEYHGGGSTDTRRKKIREIIEKSLPTRKNNTENKELKLIITDILSQIENTFAEFNDNQNNFTIKFIE